MRSLLVVIAVLALASTALAGTVLFFFFTPSNGKLGGGRFRRVVDGNHVFFLPVFLLGAWPWLDPPRRPAVASLDWSWLFRVLPCGANADLVAALAGPGFLILNAFATEKWRERRGWPRSVDYHRVGLAVRRRWLRAIDGSDCSRLLCFWEGERDVILRGSFFFFFCSLFSVALPSCCYPTRG